MLDIRLFVGVRPKVAILKRALGTMSWIKVSSTYHPVR
jgi:hypothetical protein